MSLSSNARGNGSNANIAQRSVTHLAAIHTLLLSPRGCTQRRVEYPTNLVSVSKRSSWT
jgi:hypothetical protein